jgi:hypothetical protein
MTSLYLLLSTPKADRGWLLNKAKKRIAKQTTQPTFSAKVTAITFTKIEVNQLMILNLSLKSFHKRGVNLSKNK